MNKKFLHRALIILGALALLGSAVFIALRWRDMPEKIPTHFNAAGKIDG